MNITGPRYTLQNVVPLMRRRIIIIVYNLAAFKTASCCNGFGYNVVSVKYQLHNETIAFNVKRDFFSETQMFSRTYIIAREEESAPAGF